MTRTATLTTGTTGAWMVLALDQWLNPDVQNTVWQMLAWRIRHELDGHGTRWFRQVVYAQRRPGRNGLQVYLRGEATHVYVLLELSP